MATSTLSEGPTAVPGRPVDTITEEGAHMQDQPPGHDQPELPELPDGMVPPKRKGRPRFFRGLTHMASSPSLAQTGRARSSSTPYTRSGASISCISLASSSSPFAPSSYATSSSGFAFSPLGTPGSPGPSPGPDGSFPGLSASTSITTPPSSSPAPDAIRKVDLPPSYWGAVPVVSMPADRARMAVRKKFVQLWKTVPHEIKVKVFSYLQPKELVRLSAVNREFFSICFDGQLWTRFDASDFYRDIPVQSLNNIIAHAGPFVQDLNLRGCIQVEGFDEGRAMAHACTNLVQATLEGSQINFHNLETLLSQNKKLRHVNLTGLACVNLSTCITLSLNCSQLEVLNLSWCKNVTADMLIPIVMGCPELRDLRAGEVRGLDNQRLATVLFNTNKLERLVLSGCQDLTDTAIETIMHGVDPELDVLTNRPVVPPRRLRHLDLSRCRRLTNRGVLSLGYCVPDLEGLVLAGCTALTDDALEPILASTPRLAYLDLEDVRGLTNALFSDHLAMAPCAARSLKHLSVSYCDNLGDHGMLPVMRACTALRSIELDNTRVSDMVLAEAAIMVRARTNSALPEALGTATDAPMLASRPRPGLSMAVYDCPNITWTGVREVLWRNADSLTEQAQPQAAHSAPTRPVEVIVLKCFYGWQMTVDEHTKRVLCGNRAAAMRLERKWAVYMQAHAEAGAAGAGMRRRRRRAREAQQEHAVEEEAAVEAVIEVGGTGAGSGVGRRRARTTACAIM